MLLYRNIVVLFLKVKGKEHPSEYASMSYTDSDMSGADTMSLSGGIGQKGDFDRRKKKK